MNSGFVRAVRENVWLKAMVPDTVSKEVAIILLGMVVENGISHFLEIGGKDGFSEAESKLSLLQIRRIVDEEDLLDSKNFALSLQMGLVDEINTMEKFCGRFVSGEEGFALMATRLCEIFPQPFGLVEKLLGIIRKSLPTYVGKDAEWWEKTLADHFDEQKKVLTNYWSTTTSASGFRPSRPRGTDTQLIPCPKCGWEKRCDARTKRFRCKNPKGCDIDRPFSEVVQK